MNSYKVFFIFFGLIFLLLTQGFRFEYPIKDYFVGSLNGKNVLINDKGKVINNKFKNFSLISDNLYVFHEDWNFGEEIYRLYDFSHKEFLIKIKKQFVFTIGRYFFVFKNLDKQKNPYFIINDKGEKILGSLNKKFVDKQYFSNITNQDPILAVHKGDKWGFINRKGEWLIKPKYDDAYSFSNGYAVVKKGSNYHLINMKNKIVFTSKKHLVFFDGLWVYYHELIKNKNYIFAMDLNKIEMIKYPYFTKINKTILVSIKEKSIRNIISVQKDISSKNKYKHTHKRRGIIDRKGEFIIEPNDDTSIFYVNNDILVSKKIGEKFKVKKQGKLVAEFDSIIYSINTNWYIARRENKVFFFNIKTLKKPLKETFEEALLFHKNYDRTFVKKLGKWHIMNKKGIYLMKNLDVDHVGNFGRFSNPQFIPIKKLDKWGLMNIYGEEVLPCKYDNKLLVFPESSDKLAVMHTKKNTKFVDLNNGEIVNLVKRKK